MNEAGVRGVYTGVAGLMSGWRVGLDYISVSVPFATYVGP
jgi:hypothetical protein